MSRRRRALLQSACALALLSTSASISRAMDLLVPAYFYPTGIGDDWSRMATAAKKISLTAIMNPGNGPGTTTDSNYSSSIANMHASGGRVVGYLYTDYANRPLSDVKTEVDRWVTLYNIDGIFVDEMAHDNNAAHISYYSQLYSYVKSKGKDLTVVGNPGVATLEPYVATPTVDTVVTFENFTGYASDTPPAWTNNYPSSRFANLPYEVSSSGTMSSYLATAQQRNVGNIYITDDGADGNPWDSLPGYWDSEVSGIQAITPTWNLNGSGDWNVGSRWTSGIAPNGVNATAQLTGVPTSTLTVFTNTAVTVGTLSFNDSAGYVLAGAGSLSLDVSKGSALIDVRRGQHIINLPTFVKDNAAIFVATGAGLTIADPLVLTGAITLSKNGPGSLTISSTIHASAPATIKINNGVANFTAANSDPNVSINVDPATVNITADQTLGDITLSLGGNVINLSDDAQLNAHTLHITGGGDDNLLDAARTVTIEGALQIDDSSKLVRRGAGILHVGQLDIIGSGQLDLTEGSLLIDGEPADSIRRLLFSGALISSTHPALGYVPSGGATLVRAALPADSNLDDTVNSLDFSAMASHFGESGQWSDGDFNYDGIVNALDFNLLASSYGVNASLGSVVPEPISLVVPLCLFAFTRRSRRLNP